MMDFFEKHKALILTLLFCSVILLALVNFRLTNNQENISEMRIDLQESVPQEPEEEQKETPEPEEPKAPSRETHRALNEDQQEREQALENQLEEIFKRNSAQEEDSQEEETTSRGELNLPERATQERRRSEGDDTSEETSRRPGSLRNSSISYSLKGRRAISIPNPVYTCDRAGKIVVNIRVDAGGRVTRTGINKNSSTTSNQCLIEKALEYASQARFSRLPGREGQPGTITYQFQP